MKTSLSEQQQSLTSVNRALQAFTNRHQLTKRFAEYLNNDLPPDKILFFSGDGGNGKSLFLRFLHEYCCKRFSLKVWQQWHKKPSQELVNLIKNSDDYLNNWQEDSRDFPLWQIYFLIRIIKSRSYSIIRYMLAKATEFHNDWEDWEHDVLEVPTAFLDFEIPYCGEIYPQDLFYGLLMLRKQLVDSAKKLDYNFSFILYEFACFCYLKHKKKLTSEFTTERLPNISHSPALYLLGGTFNLLRVISDIISDSKFPALIFGLPGVLSILVGSFLNFLNRYHGEALTAYLNQKKIKPEELKNIMETIADLDPDKELLDALPNLFAEDLNNIMKQENSPPRMVLFFDSHEAFWGNWQHPGETRYFKQDEWLRCLLSKLDLSKIVVVVSGREKPRWEEAIHCRIPLEKLEIKTINNFAKEDAKKYLERVKINDRELQGCLINKASLEENSIHPFLLGLCADIVRIERDQNKAITPEDFSQLFQQDRTLEILVERLLKYIDDDLRNAIEALSACQNFNWDIYLRLSQELHFNSTLAAFNNLISFSFVYTENKNGENWYHLHSSIRQVNLKNQGIVLQKAHQILEQYYREKIDIAAAINQAIYQDKERGISELLVTFTQANQEENSELCRTLEQIRKEPSF